MTDNYQFLKFVLRSYKGHKISLSYQENTKVGIVIDGVILIGGEDLDDAINNLRDHFAEKYILLKQAELGNK